MDRAPPSAKKSVRKVRPLNTSAKRQNEINRPSTPENQSIASSAGGKTSTPTMDCSTFSHVMDIDASAIHPEVSLLAGEDFCGTSKMTVHSQGDTFIFIMFVVVDKSTLLKIFID